MVTSDNLRLTMNMFAKEVHQNAVDHGWWGDPRSFGELIALCHEELSEALREYRNGISRTKHTMARTANRRESLRNLLMLSSAFWICADTMA